MSEYNWTAGYPSRIPEKMPPKEFEMGKFHIVDLTKVLDPKTESRRCRLWRFNTGGSIPDFHMENLFDHGKPNASDNLTSLQRLAMEHPDILGFGCGVIRT